MRTPNILFVIADGGRARFVKRGGPRRDFQTFHEIDGASRLREIRVEIRGRPATRSFQSAAPLSHTVGESDAMRQGKAAFIADVAAEAVAMAAAQAFDAIFIAAPGRLLRSFAGKIPDNMKVAGLLGRDLTKTPDAELHKWLQTTAASTPVSAASARTGAL